MVGPQGISGEAIRREREEHRKRGWFGERPEQEQLPSRISVLTTWLEVDWIAPLFACLVRGWGWLGLAIIVVALGLSLFSSWVVTVRGHEDGVHVVVRRLWERSARARQLRVEGAHLRYWNTWCCRGFELRGSNLAVVATTRRGRRLPACAHVLAEQVRPALRPTLRALALVFPNVAMATASIVVVRDAGRHGLSVVLLAILSLASSLAFCARGGAQFCVSGGASR